MQSGVLAVLVTTHSAPLFGFFPLFFPLFPLTNPEMNIIPYTMSDPCTAARDMLWWRVEARWEYDPDGDRKGEEQYISIDMDVDHSFWEKLDPLVVHLDVFTTHRIAPPLPSCNMFMFLKYACLCDTGFRLTGAFIGCLNPVCFNGLYASSCAIDDHVDFSPLTALTHLYLKKCGIEDVSGLVFPSHSFHLSLSWNKIRDVSGLQYMPVMRSVNLSHNPIDDISLLRVPVYIGELFLTHTGIDNVLALDLSNSVVGVIDLGHNHIESLNGWKHDKRTWHINVDNNKLTDEGMMGFVPQLDKRRWYVFSFKCNRGITDIYPVYSKCQRAGCEFEISYAECTLSELSMQLIHMPLKRGCDVFGQYMQMVGFMIVARSAQEVAGVCHAPLSRFPKELCWLLKAYLF